MLQDGLYRTVKGIAAADLNVTVMRSRRKDVKKLINVPSSVKGEVKQGQKLGEIVYQLDRRGNRQGRYRVSRPGADGEYIHQDGAEDGLNI